MNKEYLLKSKDTNILLFREVEDKFGGYYLEELEVLNKDLLPLGYTNITKFINSRKPPNNREYIKEVLRSIDYNKASPMGLADITLGLSLNDTYWVVPYNSDLKWEDYNLYRNRFNELISKIAFTGKLGIVNNASISPEFTTNGMLKKCWKRNGSKIELIKGGTSGFANTGFEPYTEYYSCQILEKLGIPYINYELDMYHNELVSISECFCDEDTSYVPIYNLLTEDELKCSNPIQNIITRQHIMGRQFYSDMYMFDYIILNYDRHLGNFGLYVDSNTNKIKGPANIYDNGMGLLSMNRNEDFLNGDIDKWINERQFDTFGYLFEAGLKATLTKESKEKTELLLDFEIKPHKKYNLPNYRLEYLNEFIRKRVKEVLNTPINSHKEIVLWG